MVKDFVSPLSGFLVPLEGNVRGSRDTLEGDSSWSLSSSLGNSGVSLKYVRF